MRILTLHSHIFVKNLAHNRRLGFCIDQWLYILTLCFYFSFNFKFKLVVALFTMIVWKVTSLSE